MEECIPDILSWYQKNKRDLPWRRDIDPYHVWISEVMLQQTRIESVISYYYRFLKKLPKIEDLAKVSEDVLLKLWEGLGYYNRARNLKKTAQIIVENYHGVFPMTYEELIMLPGIGEYTASAIASICFHEKKAVIDGNVLRVYTRFYNDSSNIDQAKTKKEIKEKLEKIIPDNSGDFNEAVMEIGEVICIPNGLPHCNQCPLSKKCLAKKYQNYLSYPKKCEKKEKKAIEYTIFIFKYDNRYAICKRRKEKLLNQLWEFPNVEGSLNKEQVQTYLTNNKISYLKIKKFISNTHIFTHQKWNMISYYIELEKMIEDNNLIFLNTDTIKKNYAIPTAFQPFLEELIYKR